MPMAHAKGPVTHKIRGWLTLSASAGLAALLLAAQGPVGPVRAAETVLPVPRVTIYPGNVITEDVLVDRAFGPRDYDGSGIIASREALVGKVARATLLPNRPVSVGGVREPFAVQQGQPAVVYFQSGALVISAVAVPLQPGSAGEVISLRNTDSGTTIRGMVQADGTVRVGMP